VANDPRSALEGGRVEVTEWLAGGVGLVLILIDGAFRILGVLMPNIDGLVNVPSGLTVKETADRVAASVVSKGLTLFARIDHAANARQVGMELRPTELLVFGNPKAGTILMQDQQLSGFDLPIRALVWQDDDGKVWLTYSDTAWLAARYRLGTTSDATLRAIGEGLSGLGSSLAATNAGDR
jgi:uncharacterized protein (DUF302 family)